MKITKEEKSLYNFLKIFNTIFGKSEYRNTIVGRGNKCYFFANGYVGIFKDEDRDTLVGGNYDFKKHYYELKQTPNKAFILDVIDFEDRDFDELIEEQIAFADTLMDCNGFRLDYKKDYEYKISKIAKETGVWLKDTDIKYLNSFKEVEIFQLEDSVIVKSFGLTDEDCSNVTTVLVFVGEVHPNIDDSTQQRMNVTPLIEDLSNSELNKPLNEAEQLLKRAVTHEIDVMEDGPFPEEALVDEDRDIEDYVPQAPFDDEGFF